MTVLNFKHNDVAYTASYSLDNVNGYNCALKYASNWHVERKDRKKFSKQELYDALGDVSFDNAMVEANNKQPAPSGFILSTGLVYNNRNVDESDAYGTQDVMAGIVRSKNGAYISTPIYDNKGHPVADSIQVCLIWFPEANTPHILTSKPFWRIPKEKIRKGMLEKWKWRGERNEVGMLKAKPPYTLHDAVEMVRKNFGNFKINPIPQVELAPIPKGPPIDGWADIA